MHTGDGQTQAQHVARFSGCSRPRLQEPQPGAAASHPFRKAQHSPGLRALMWGLQLRLGDPVLGTGAPG